MGEAKYIYFTCLKCNKAKRKILFFQDILIDYRDYGSVVTFP